ncbi:hypothetical protein [Plantactinospora mayteni]|nr:hypothetical protein [Plantactinospora mayteni]
MTPRPPIWRGYALWCDGYALARGGRLPGNASTGTTGRVVAGG